MKQPEEMWKQAEKMQNLGESKVEPGLIYNAEMDQKMWNPVEKMGHRLEKK